MDRDLTSNMTGLGANRINVIGVGVSAVDMESALEVLRGWLAKGEANYVCVRDVHGVVECRRDPKLRQIHNQAGLVTPDGMPLVWVAHWMGFKQVKRVYGPDLMLEVCRLSVQTGWRHYFLGGKSGVPELLAQSMRERFPGLNVVGTLSPPFRPLTVAEDQEMVSAIRRTNPDIVWVGLGTPKQEHWMAEHVGRLGNAVLIGVGAAFDFHSGRKRQAPLWIRQSGLEWLFRLVSEPGRLGRRYLRNNPIFISLLLLQALRLKRFTLE